jgi:hypothetical protein
MHIYGRVIQIIKGCEKEYQSDTFALFVHPLPVHPLPLVNTLLYTRTHVASLVIHSFPFLHLCLFNAFVWRLVNQRTNVSVRGCGCGCGCVFAVFLPFPTHLPLSVVMCWFVKTCTYF